MKISLPKAAVRKIYQVVDELYDKAIARFLARKTDKKIKFKLRVSLPDLFNAAAYEERTPPDKGTLNTLLEIAEGFVNSQRHATKAHVVKSVEGWLNSAQKEGVKTDLDTVLGGELGGIFNKAYDGMQKIVATESTTAKNLGGLTGITLVNSAAGVEDPVVYFVIVRDGVTCDECKRLHLLDDGVTPRLWYLSEVGHGYHKKGDSNPKMSGLHTHCRCSMTSLLPGWGFDAGGMITYVGPSHNEMDSQRGLGKKEPVWGPYADLLKSTPLGEKHYNRNRERFDQNGELLGYAEHLDPWLQLVKEKKGLEGDEALAHLSATPVTVALPAHVFQQALQDGRLKNVFETNSSNGAESENVSESDPGYLRIRKRLESSLFGIPHNAGGEERPIYGSVDKQWIEGNAPATHGYGNVVLTLKPHVKNRSTFTPDDSFCLDQDDSHYFVTNHRHIPKLLSLSRPGVGYVEAQIHGGVDLSRDIDSIHVYGNSRRFKAPEDAELVKVGRRLGVPVHKCILAPRDSADWPPPPPLVKTVYHPDWDKSTAPPKEAPAPPKEVELAGGVKKSLQIENMNDFKLFKKEKPVGVFLSFQSEEPNLPAVVLESVQKACQDGRVFTDNSQAFKIFVKNRKEADLVMEAIQTKILGEDE